MAYYKPKQVITSLSNNSKRNLFSSSAIALKLCTPSQDQNMSYQTLHVINKRATPPQFMNYKLSIILFKIYNFESDSNEWLFLFFNQNVNTLCEFVNFFDSSNLKIGKNLLSNCFLILNGKIKCDWLNLPLNPFKIKSKNEFLCLA